MTDSADTAGEFPGQFVILLGVVPEREWPGWPIWRLREPQAQLLIERGLAGYWTVSGHYRGEEIKPIAHPEYCCAFVHSTWYLCGSSVIRVTDHGRVNWRWQAILGSAVSSAQAHVVHIEKDSPLYPLIEKDIAEHTLTAGGSSA